MVRILVSEDRVKEEAKELVLDFNHNLKSAAEVQNSSNFASLISFNNENYSEILLTYKLLRWKYLNSGRFYIQVGGYSQVK